MNNTTQLIPVFNGELNHHRHQLCNARDLHSFLAVGRDFATWIKGRIEQYGFVEGEDYSPVFGNSYGVDSDVCSPVSGSNPSSRGGHNRVEYHLTLDMAKELAMVENNENGRQVRRYFIAMERQARDSRGATYLTVAQQLAIHRQVPKLLAQLKSETTHAVREILHAQLVQHCHLLTLPVPALQDVGRSKHETGDLFPETRG